MKLVTVSHDTPSVTVLHLQDRLNMGNTSELELAAKQAYATGARRLIIDLTKVPSITSAGIRSILIIHKMLAGTGNKSDYLKLAGPTKQVREVLKIAGLLNHLEIYDNVEQALAAF